MTAASGEQYKRIIAADDAAKRRASKLKAAALIAAQNAETTAIRGEQARLKRECAARMNRGK